MSKPRAFISFDFDHNEDKKQLFIGQIKNSKTPFNAEDWSSKESLPQTQWEKLIDDKIGRCDMLIVLVGRSTFRASGVIKEIAFAQAHSIPIFGVYVDNADVFTPLPKSLPRVKVIPWDWEKIAKQIMICTLFWINIKK